MYIYIHTHIYMVAQMVKCLAYNGGDLGSIPGEGRSSGEGNGNPLQYSCLENPMDRGAWWATVHGVAKSWTRLSDFTSLYIQIHGKISLEECKLLSLVMSLGCVLHEVGQERVVEVGYLFNLMKNIYFYELKRMTNFHYILPDLLLYC